VIADYHARRLILTPPHTASRRLHQAITGTPGRHWVIGPGPEGPDFDHHTTHIAPEFTGWEIVAVIRHPHERIRGLRRHAAWDADLHGRPLAAWPDWLALIARNHNALPWYFRYTIDRWLGPMEPDHYWRFERLAELLAVHYPDVEMGDPYPLKHDPPAWEPETLATIEAWAAPDLARFGYSP
jgi:hypothetical protein